MLMHTAMSPQLKQVRMPSLERRNLSSEEKEIDKVVGAMFKNSSPVSGQPSKVTETHTTESIETSCTVQQSTSFTQEVTVENSTVVNESLISNEANVTLAHSSRSSRCTIL